MIYTKVRSYFIAGLVVWLPILATFLVIRFIVGVMDSTLSLLPAAYQPPHLYGIAIPGLGIVLSIVVLLFTGILVTNYLGGRLVALGEAILARIPLVNTIYHSVKQVLQTVFSSGTDSFRHVVLLEYPRTGVWTLGLQTAAVPKELSDKTQKELISVYIPSTPNPTSGFFIMVPKSTVIVLDMSVDEAVKYIISLGVVQ